MPAQYTIPSIFTAIDRFSGPMRGMSRAVNEFVVRSEVGLARVERGFRKLMKPIMSLNNMLSGLGYYIGLFTVMLLLRNAVGVMADFQQANVDLALVMETTVEKNKKLAFQAREVGLAYGIAATQVSKLQYELATLGFKQPDILSMTPAIISGSVALKASPDELAKTVGAIIQSFKQFEPKDAQRIVDLMTKAANETALTFESMQTMLPTTSKPSDVVNMSFESLLAHLGVLSNAQVHVATAGTAMKNMMIDTSVKGKQLDETLTKISEKTNVLGAAFKKFQKRSAVSATVLATELEQVGKLEKMFTEQTKAGLADQMAIDRLKTFTGTATLAKSAYQEFILSIDNGTGKWAASLMQINKVIAAMFLIESGSDESRSAISKLDQKTLALAHTWLFFAKMLLGALAIMTSVWVGMKIWAAAIILVKVAMVGLAFVFGILTPFMTAMPIWIGRSIFTLYAYRIAVGLVTAAQWAWNAAIAANPLFWIPAIIIGVIVLIYKMVDAWNEWGAALSVPMAGGIGGIITLVQALRRNWDELMKAFSEGGLVAGLKMFGRILSDAILMPMEQLLKLMHQMTGLKMFEAGAKMAHAIRQTMGVNLDTDENGNPLPGHEPKAAQGQNEMKPDQNNDPARQGKLLLEYLDPSGKTKLSSKSDWVDIMPRVGSTMTFGQF